MLGRNQRRLIITCILALTMMLTTGLNTYSQPVYDNYNEEDVVGNLSNLEKNDYDISIAEEISGISSDSNVENLFSKLESDSIEKNSGYDALPKLKNVSLVAIKDNFINFKGQLVLSETNIYELSSTGKVYTSNEGTLREKAFLIDIENDESYRFVQIRIDTNEEQFPFISIMLQNILTEELFYFETIIDSQVLVEVASIADYAEKEIFFNLYDVEKNLINSVEPAVLRVKGTGDSTSSRIEAFIDDNGNDISRETETYNNFEESLVSPLGAPYSAWTGFFGELDRYGFAYLRDHRIDRYVITDNGWQHVSEYDRGPYAISSYVRQNGRYEKLVDIIMIEVVHTSDRPTEQGLYLYVEHLFKLSYDEDNGRVTVLYYNWGPWISDVELVLGIEDGISNSTTVFTSRIIGGRLSRKPNILGAAIGLIDRTEKWFNLWGNLQETVNETFGEKRRFEDTFTKQSDKYKGKVIKIIYADSERWELDSEGNYMYIEGDVYNGYRDCSRYSWDYRVTTFR